MSTRLAYVAVDVAVGLLVAGVLTALAAALAPEDWRGPGLVWAVAIPSLLGFGLLRRAFVRMHLGRRS